MQKGRRRGSTQRWGPEVPAALRFPAYRAYWLGTVASVTGYQILFVALGWLTYHLTASPLYLGYVGAAAGVPAILLNLYGGVLADKVDNRRLIIATQVIVAALILLLAIITQLDVVRPWHILAIAFATGSVGAFEMPARQSLYPHLIERDALPSAVALNTAVWQGTRIAAPAIAGLLAVSRNGTES